MIFALVHCLARYCLKNYNIMHTYIIPFSSFFFFLWTSGFSHLIIIFLGKLAGLMSCLTTAETCFEFLGEMRSY